jgi:hypothetical protein
MLNLIPKKETFDPDQDSNLKSAIRTLTAPIFKSMESKQSIVRAATAEHEVQE